MVPLRLRLKNFLSYGDDAPVLDLEGIHVACLSGGNGQGKSALLDAMTWAVWGEARKSSEARKPDEELLRIGAKAMEVDFAFRVSGVEYRVVRSYSESASGKTSKPGLGLQVRDGDDWQAMTAGSIRATQAAIDERIGIDYETFINSTFLLQGRSDEFTKKKPGERKEILGKILALDRYDRMAAAAGKRWSHLREQASTLEAERDRLDAALGPVEDWHQERTAVAQVVETTKSELVTAQEMEQRAAATLATLDAAQREADTLRAALADLAQRSARLDTDAATASVPLAVSGTLDADGPVEIRVLVRWAETDSLVAEVDQVVSPGAFRVEAPVVLPRGAVGDYSVRVSTEGTDGRAGDQAVSVLRFAAASLGPPTVTVTDPAPVTRPTGTNIVTADVVATVSDPDGRSNIAVVLLQLPDGGGVIVRLFDGGTGSDTQAGDGRYSVGLGIDSAFEPGSYALEVVAVDRAGEASAPAPFTLTVR